MEGLIWFRERILDRPLALSDITFRDHIGPDNVITDLSLRMEPSLRR